MVSRFCARTEVIILVGAYKAERTPNEAAVIRFVSPTDGATFEKGSEVEVEIEFDSFELGQAENHWHLYVNGQSPRLIVGATKNVVLRDLEPGQHQISAYLALGTHLELEDGATITISVY